MKFIKLCIIGRSDIIDDYLQKYMIMKKIKNQKDEIKEVLTNNNLLFKVGFRYIIDKRFRNGGEIELVKIYGKYFCRVKCIDNGAEWDTMLNRLSCCD